MRINHQTVIDSQGQPAAALIPWGDFLRIREMIDGDGVSEEEAVVLREAEADRRSGNDDAFYDLSALKTELSLP